METNGTVSERGDDASIQTENPDITFLTSIREKLETVPPLSSTCSIHKVPKMLRSVNDKAYNPKVISIGPFHRGEESLQVMEEHKWRYLRIFLDWYPQIKLEDYVEVLRGLEESARQCYVEPIKLGSYEFVEMMLLDGFFILVLFLKMWTREWDSRDPIFRTRWMLGPIMLDMLLLENQIPFFVLERLFQLSEVPNQDDERRPSLLELTYVFFRKFLKRDEILDQTISRSEVKHLLDFVRSFLLPSSIMVLPHDDTRYDFTPTATELHEAGVEFKVVKSNCLLDISFRNRVLEIPFLKIEDGTELLFRNLIAWEQCQTLLNCEITSYAYLMDGLIKTPKDVDLLIQCGIIENRLGDNKDVSRLFNNFGKEFTIESDKFYFSSICENLNAHYSQPWNKQKASLRRDYFNTPWALINFIGAIVVQLTLTSIQTVCALISVKNTNTNG